MKRGEKIRRASMAFAEEMARGEFEKSSAMLKCIALELHKYHIDDELIAIIDAYNSVVADLYRKTGVKVPNYPTTNYVVIVIDGRENKISHSEQLPRINTTVSINPDSEIYDEIKFAWSRRIDAHIYRQNITKQMADKLNKMKQLPSLSELTHEKLLEIWEREE